MSLQDYYKTQGVKLYSHVEYIAGELEKAFTGKYSRHFFLPHGFGKTTLLFNAAKYWAINNPDKKAVFLVQDELKVTNCPQNLYILKLEGDTTYKLAIDFTSKISKVEAIFLDNIITTHESESSVLSEWELIGITTVLSNNAPYYTMLTRTGKDDLGSNIISIHTGYRDEYNWEYKELDKITGKEKITQIVTRIPAMNSQGFSTCPELLSNYELKKLIRATAQQEFELTYQQKVNDFIVQEKGSMFNSILPEPINQEIAAKLETAISDKKRILVVTKNIDLYAGLVVFFRENYSSGCIEFEIKTPMKYFSIPNPFTYKDYSNALKISMRAVVGSTGKDYLEDYIDNCDDWGIKNSYGCEFININLEKLTKTDAAFTGKVIFFEPIVVYTPDSLQEAWSKIRDCHNNLSPLFDIAKSRVTPNVYVFPPNSDNEQVLEFDNFVINGYSQWIKDNLLADTDKRVIVINDEFVQGDWETVIEV